VVGDAALTFDPGSPEEMADKIWSLWSDDAMRHKFRIKGLEKVKQFSWENMARQTIDVYGKALG
jgi:glycosyltransferase involved in cell wall biosynthesis